MILSKRLQITWPSNNHHGWSTGMHRTLKKEVRRVCGTSAHVVGEVSPFISFDSAKAQRKWENSACWKRLHKTATAVGLGVAIVEYM